MDSTVPKCSRNGVSDSRSSMTTAVGATTYHAIGSSTCGSGSGSEGRVAPHAFFALKHPHSYPSYGHPNNGFYPPNHHRWQLLPHQTPISSSFEENNNNNRMRDGGCSVRGAQSPPPDCDNERDAITAFAALSSSLLSCSSSSCCSSSSSPLTPHNNKVNGKMNPHLTISDGRVRGVSQRRCEENFANHIMGSTAPDNEHCPPPRRHPHCSCLHHHRGDHSPRSDCPHNYYSDDHQKGWSAESQLAMLIAGESVWQPYRYIPVIPPSMRWGYNMCSLHACITPFFSNLRVGCSTQCPPLPHYMSPSAMNGNNTNGGDLCPNKNAAECKIASTGTQENDSNAKMNSKSRREDTSRFSSLGEIDYRSPVEEGDDDDEDDEDILCHPFELSVLWASLEEASTYGVEAPYMDSDGLCSQVAYIPYLSALCLIEKSHEGGEGEKEEGYNINNSNNEKNYTRNVNISNPSAKGASSDLRCSSQNSVNDDKNNNNNNNKDNNNNNDNNNNHNNNNNNNNNHASRDNDNANKTTTSNADTERTIDHATSNRQEFQLPTSPSLGKSSTPIPTRGHSSKQNGAIMEKSNNSDEEGQSRGHARNRLVLFDSKPPYVRRPLTQMIRMLKEASSQLRCEDPLIPAFNSEQLALLDANTKLLDEDSWLAIYWHPVQTESRKCTGDDVVQTFLICYSLAGAAVQRRHINAAKRDNCGCGCNVETHNNNITDKIPRLWKGPGSDFRRRVEKLSRIYSKMCPMMIRITNEPRLLTFATIPCFADSALWSLDSLHDGKAAAKMFRENNRILCEWLREHRIHLPDLEHITRRQKLARRWVPSRRDATAGRPRANNGLRASTGIASEAGGI